MISIKQIQNGWLVQINDAGWHFLPNFKCLQAFLLDEGYDLLTS